MSLEKLIEIRTALCRPSLWNGSGAELLNLAKRFKKLEPLYIQEYGSSLIPQKIAILSSYTSFHWVQILKLFFYRQSIQPLFYEAEYNTMVAEILNQDSDLYKFEPDLIILGVQASDISQWPPLLASVQTMSDWLESQLAFYQTLWETLRPIKNVQVLQTLFVPTLTRQLGNFESTALYSQRNSLLALNLSLVKNKPSHVHFIDMDFIASSIGKEQWTDERNHFMSKQGFSLEASGRLSHLISKVAAAKVGKQKKCLVLDLDNTLWGGVIGDDGLEGICLDPNHAVGEAYLAWQDYVLALKNRGILLAVCSKNEEDIAKLPFQNHPHCKLKLEDFSCFIANWQDKATNLRLIANTLNIGIESLVFFDDNPAERAIVRQFCPEVEVVEVPEDPAFYCRALDQEACFEILELTPSDLNRSDTYQHTIKRQELQTTFVDYDSYLKSLHMKASVQILGQAELARFTQLINKSNQFNLRTQRYTAGYLEQLMEQKNYQLLAIHLKDLFSDFGIISCLIIEKKGSTAFIDTWVMSCRVLKRGVEKVALNAILSAAQELGCTQIVGEFIPTSKNKLVEHLLPDLDFIQEKKQSENSLRYVYEVNGLSHSHFITVEGN